jgi:hypothetical protein
MRKTSRILAAATALVALSVAPVSPFLQSAQAACDAGDRIDRSTAADAQKMIQRAGYSGVSELKKSCDNSWHGKALKDGQQIRVVLTPQGQIIPEGD